ncbi:MAG: sporulation protein YunB [Bacillota bacterium]
MRRRNSRTQKKYSNVFSIVWCVVMLSILFLFLCIITFEKSVLPSLMELSHARTKNMANEILDHTLQDLLQESELTTKDFIIETTSGDQMYINSHTINRFCSDLSLRLNSKIGDISEETIYIPIGAATNLSFFSDTGPTIPFYIFPVGIVTSDYETEFSATGINQTNYKIWIYITIEIQIVNPFYKESVAMHKKIMLVDTIIRGEVPEQYVSLEEVSDYSDLPL